MADAAATATAPAAPPKVHPGERLANYFDNFFKTVVAISTFGSSLTFSKIVQTPVAPWDDYGFSKFSVQYFLANAFLLFVLDLAITSLAASALVLYRPQAVDWFGTNDSRERRVVMWYATVVSAVLFGLLISAFLFVALVVVAYAGPAGWVALAATVFFGALVFGVILWQSPLFKATIGADQDTMATNMRMYGYTDEKTDRYTTPTKRRMQDVGQRLERRSSARYSKDSRLDSGYDNDGTRDHGYRNGTTDTGYNSEKVMTVDGRYVSEEPTWRTTVPHVPATPADLYYEDRRSSRARRTSAPVPKYYEYDEDDRV